MMRYLLYIIFAVGHTVAQSSHFLCLKDQLYSCSLKVDYVEETVMEFKIRKAKISNSLIRKKVEGEIKKEYNKSYCKGKAKSEINCDVTCVTNCFVSLRKELAIVFCPDYPSDIVECEFFNCLVYKNKIFVVQLNKSDDLKNRVMKKINSGELDPDCNFKYEDLKLDLFFKDGKAFVNAAKDKVCVFQIEIEIRESNFIFTPE